MSNHPTYNLTNHPNAITNHPNQFANHPNRFTNAPAPDSPWYYTLPQFQPHDQPGGGGGAPNPGNAFAPDPNAPYNPVLFSSFMRHKYWMDNAQNRGDDTATYGAGPMKTMAF